MTVRVMMYLLAVSLVFATAAWLADHGLRRLGLPTRGVWLTALAAPAVLAAVALLVPERASVLALSGVPMAGAIELPELVIGNGDDSSVIGWSGALLAAWLLASLTTIAIVLRAQFQLARERRKWPREEVAGRTVFVSPDRGPAAAGMMTPWIVLPRWILELPERQRALVVLHEEEHIRGGDTHVLNLGLAVVCLTPWNPVVWWQLARMRTAMEVDCDRRVLRRHPEPAIYGDSLLVVASRAANTGLALAAFSERPHTLRHRIHAMTETRTHGKSFRAALLVLAACVVAVQACGVEGPVGVDEAGIQSLADISKPTVDLPAGQDAAGASETPDLPEPPAAAADIQAGPTFTPFTEAPTITNRDDVIRTMTESYPPLLRDAGIGGTVRVFFLIDDEGVVEQVRIDKSSGHEALDEAALNVAGAYRFTAAMNRDTPVPVWVSFPITFAVR